MSGYERNVILKAGSSNQYRRTNQYRSMHELVKHREKNCKYQKTTPALAAP